MNAEIVMLNAAVPTCSARTKSDILIVFCPPAEAKLAMGDILDFDLLALDCVQQVENLTKRQHLAVEVKSHDIHDLRLPSIHGTSRFPSLERRKNA